MNKYSLHQPLFILLSSLIVPASFFFLHSSPLFAQETKTQQFQIPVKATMPDVVPPSTPILISPDNGALLSTDRPQFVWQKSTDKVAMSHYQLIINNELVIDDIFEPGSFEQYNLAFSSELDRYFLDIKFSLDDDHHSWKIIAVDEAGLSNSSAAWSFTVDTIAPYFVLTQIGDKEASISTLDATTVPQEPLQILVNEPTLLAHGEALSTVQLTVMIPNRDDYFIEEDIDAQGQWQHNLPILPRDTVITLNFTIIDLARHISVIENIPIVIPSKMPVPREIIYDLVRDLTPTPIWRVTTRSWFQQTLYALGPYLTLLIVSWPAITATLLLFCKLDLVISGKNLIKIWRALEILPFADRAGWVFDSRLAKLDQQGNLIYDQAEPTEVTFPAGVPFAKIFAVNEAEQPGFPPFYKTTLTDHRGLYLPLNLPLKTYRISVQHPDYQYPTLQNPPPHTKTKDYYQAQEIETNINQTSLSLQIPADSDRAQLNTKFDNLISLIKKHDWSWSTRWQLWLAKLIKFDNLLVLFNIILAVTATLFWTNLINIIALTIYILFGLLCLFKQKLFANINGMVLDKNGNSVQNAMVRLTSLDESGQVYADVTNKKGQFNFYFKKGRFKLDVVKFGMKQAESSPESSQLQAKAWWEQQRIMIMMIKE